MSDQNLKPRFAKPGTVDYEIMTKTDPALMSYLRAMSPDARGAFLASATGLYRQRVQAHLDKLKLVFVRTGVTTVDHAPLNRFKVERELTEAEEKQEINKRVAEKINFYQNAGKQTARARTTKPYNDEKFAAWDLAREDYRKVNLKGGDPNLEYDTRLEIRILRDAEHYLFRFWITSARGVVTIPNGVPSMEKGPYNPPLAMHWAVMGIIHDPIYNFLRQTILEKITNMAPTTPEMSYWEEKGYRDGIAQSSAASDKDAPSCVKTDSCPNTFMGHR
jgi:hypothetical protein